MIWLVRFFVVSPMIVIYLFHETHHGMLRDRVGPVKWLAATLVCLGVIWVWDVLRKPPRTLPSVILARMLITSMLVFSIFLMFGSGWYFWFMLSHSVVWLLVGCSYSCIDSDITSSTRTIQMETTTQYVGRGGIPFGTDFR